MPSSIGSNSLGLWFPVVPAVLLFVYQGRQSGWQTVKHDLLVGTVITAISYALLFLYCVVRNLYREHVALVRKVEKLNSELEYIQTTPLWTGYGSEQAWRAAIDEQNRLVALGHLADGALGPYQIEAIKIVKDLRELLHELGPQPVCDTTSYLNDPDLNAKELSRWHDEIEPWRKKLRSKFALNIAPRVKELMHRFGEQGIAANPLIHYSEVIQNEQQVPVLQAQLICLAYRMDGIKLRPEKPNEA